MKPYSSIITVLLALTICACSGTPNNPLQASIPNSPSPSATPAPSPSATATPTPAPSVRAGVVIMGSSDVARWDMDIYFPGRGIINGGRMNALTLELREALPAILDGSEVCHGNNVTPPDAAFPWQCGKINPPDTVFVFAGWEDILASANMVTAIDDIRQMQQLAHDSGVRMILATPPVWDAAHLTPSMNPNYDGCHLDATLPYHDQWFALRSGILSIANDFQVIALDMTQSPLFPCNSGFTIDGFLPNDVGYKQRSNIALAILRSFLEIAAAAEEMLQAGQGEATHASGGGTDYANERRAEDMAGNRWADEMRNWDGVRFLEDAAEGKRAGVKCS